MCENAGLGRKVDPIIAELLQATTNRARMEEQKLHEERVKKEAEIASLQESRRRNELLQEILNTVRTLLLMVESEFSPKITALSVKIDFLSKIQEMVINLMKQEPSSKEYSKEFDALIYAFERLKIHSVNVHAGSINTGADLNLNSLTNKHEYVGE
jgi:hypothetical protein